MHVNMGISGSPLAIKLLLPDHYLVVLHGIHSGRGSFYAGGIASSADNLCVKGRVLLRDRRSLPPIIGKNAPLDPRLLDWNLYFDNIPLNHHIKLIIEASNTCGHTANVVANLYTQEQSTAKAHQPPFSPTLTIKNLFPNESVFHAFACCVSKTGNPGNVTATATQGGHSVTVPPTSNPFLCPYDYHFDFDLSLVEFDEIPLKVEVNGDSGSPLPHDEVNVQLEAT